MGNVTRLPSSKRASTCLEDTLIYLGVNTTFRAFFLFVSIEVNIYFPRNRDASFTAGYIFYAVIIGLIKKETAVKELFFTDNLRTIQNGKNASKKLYRFPRRMVHDLSYLNDE